MAKRRTATPGECLRNLRTRLGLTTRRVAELSRVVSAEQGSEEYGLTHARVQQIETGDSMPSLQKLFTLSSVYGVPIQRLFAAYLDPDAAELLHARMAFPNTHTDAFDAGPREVIPFRTRMESTAQGDPATTLSEVTQAWGEAPGPLLSHIRRPSRRYGFIGLRDYTMYPLIPPGSVVQFAECCKVARPAAYQSEFERPIYFLQLRTGYMCSWCERRGDRLISIPHPLSPCSSRSFEPEEAEVVGRVTGVAIRFDQFPISGNDTGEIEPLRDNFDLATAG